MQIPIVFEDNDLLVINKPAGLLTHPVNRKDTSHSVAGWLLKRYPEIKNVLDKEGKTFGQWVDLRPGIVHRLDRGTSGLMIIAKNQSAFEYLKKQFQERKIKKTYLALAHGLPKDRSGRIDLPLGKIGIKQSIRLHGKKELKEKRAITEYRVVKSYKLKTKSYSLLEVSPLTGRTHQIRVHFKSLGHPVVGDRIYGPKTDREFSRLFLHAQKLEFTSPAGQRLVLEADPPEELTDFLKLLTIT